MRAAGIAHQMDMDTFDIVDSFTYVANLTLARYADRTLVARTAVTVAGR